MRVKFISLDGFPTPSPDFLYVGQPFQAPDENSAQSGLTFTVAPLTCDPYFHIWSNEGIISIYGAEIMPGSVYEVQRAGLNCPNLADEQCWSAVNAQHVTLKFGDCAPLFEGPGNPPQPDFNDIAALVNKFLALPEGPPKYRCQLQPNVVFPERPIDFRDIAADVQAFLGVAYADMFYGPCPCPSSVTCGATPCTSDLACGGGICLSTGFCGDECGRCTPPAP